MLTRWTACSFATEALSVVLRQLAVHRCHASRARADRWYLSGAGQASSIVADGTDRPVLREAAVVGRLGFLIDAACACFSAWFGCLVRCGGARRLPRRLRRDPDL